MKNFFLDRRSELGLSQRRIAIALDMTDSAVGSWERGDACPRLTLAPKLAKVYGVTTERIEQEIVKLSRELTKREPVASAEK